MAPEDSRDRHDTPPGAPASDSGTRAGAEGAGASSSAPSPALTAVKPAASTGGAQPAAGGASAAAAPPAAQPPAAGGAAAAKAAAAPLPPPPEPEPIDEFDPIGWDVPIICKDCDKPFAVPYRNFHAGVVFHCPSCQGSWVPNTTIAKGMRQVFENFWSPAQASPRGFRARRTQGQAEGRARRVRAPAGGQLKEFKKRLERLAAELKPPASWYGPRASARHVRTTLRPSIA